MHPALNYRQSRRSACDRCRGFKLRCERDQVNGRFCERCLKAQVPCTTSVGQPVSNYLPTKPGSGSMPRDFDGRILNSERMSMPGLHKSTMSKVRKPLGSSAMSRRHENQKSNGWTPPDLFPYDFTGTIYPAGEGVSLQVPSQHNSSFPLEQLNDPYSSWAPNPYQLVSYTFHDFLWISESTLMTDVFSMTAVNGGWAIRVSIPLHRTALVLPNACHEHPVKRSGRAKH